MFKNQKDQNKDQDPSFNFYQQRNSALSSPVILHPSRDLRNDPHLDDDEKKEGLVASLAKFNSSETDLLIKASTGETLTFDQRNIMGEKQRPMWLEEDHRDETEESFPDLVNQLRGTHYGGTSNFNNSQHSSNHNDYTSNNVFSSVGDTFHDDLILDSKPFKWLERKHWVLPIAVSIISWYAFSTILMIINKMVIGKKLYNFSFPLFMSSTNMMIQALLSDLILLYKESRDRKRRNHKIPSFYDEEYILEAGPLDFQLESLGSRSNNNHMAGEGEAGFTEGQRAAQSNFQSSEGKRQEWKKFLTGVFPCVLASGLDVGCSTASLQFITLTFYTMVKSSAPIFVLAFAFAFKLEKPTVRLLVIISVIAVGVFLSVMDETEFDVTGFTLVLAAAVLSGLRWSLTQILLGPGKSTNPAGNSKNLTNNHNTHSNPLNFMKKTSPLMAILLLTLSILFERPYRLFNNETNHFFSSFINSFRTIGLISLSGVTAFFMVLTEFYLISLTSVVTLSVAGIFKELVVIAASSVAFGDTLTPVNIIGFIISLVGIGMYNYYKLKGGLGNSHRTTRIVFEGDQHNDEHRGILPRKEQPPPPTVQSEQLFRAGSPPKTSHIM